MAQTGYTPILLYGSTTSGNTPVAGNLTTSASGVELAINAADGKLFFKNTSGVVTLLASSTATSGTFTTITDSGLTMGQVVFPGAGGLLSGSANLYWDNTNFRLGIGTSTPSVSLAFGTTDAILVPAGTTAQRPATPVVGEIRYNTTNFQFEGYSGATPAWLPVGGSVIMNDTTTNALEYPIFVNSTSGTATTVYTSSPDYQFNPALGTLYASQVGASNGLLMNQTTINKSYTIDTGYNAISVGPITIASGQTVTVGAGQRWVVI